MLGFYIKYVVRNTGIRGERNFLTELTSTPQQMHVILWIYQHLYISELRIFFKLSMHNTKIKAAPQSTHRKPPAVLVFKLLWQQPERPQPCITGDVMGTQWLKWHIQFIYAWILHVLFSTFFPAIYFVSSKAVLRYFLSFFVTNTNFLRLGKQWGFVSKFPNPYRNEYFNWHNENWKICYIWYHDMLTNVIIE